MIRIYFIILFFCFSFLGFSQEEKDSLQLAVDTSQELEARSYDKELTEKYSGEEFDYSSPEGGAKNLLSRFLRWLSNVLEDTFGFNIDPAVFKILEVIIYIAMGILAIYLLVRFFSGENLSSLFLKKATPIVDINLSEEHIENIDLDARINEAIAQNDYRLAVRYHYLSALKNLSLKEIITWEYEKTNSDYQNEIAVAELKPLFQEVSYLYDYIWYGEQDIDALGFNEAEARFAALKNSIPN
ncbi:MAG: hypothetical protein AB8B59_06925 [Maribacter sp.]